MIRIMIVDDEPFIRQGLQILINWEQYGFTICGEASNGIEAIELMQSQNFDLIITDIRMPQMDGIALMEYTRDHISKDIKFLLLSGFYEFEYARKAIKFDVTDYILKPVQREELIRVLEDYKEQFNKEAEYRKKIEQTEKLVFDRYLSQLITGTSENSSVAYVTKYLADSSELRYISIEYDQTFDPFFHLKENEKRKEQNLLYDTLKEQLGEHWFHAFMDNTNSRNDYAVGFIYTKKLASYAQTSEKKYIAALYECLSSRLLYKIVLYIGQKVEDITFLSESYTSSMIAKSFQLFSDCKEISYYDEIEGRLNADKYPMDKSIMDHLIRAIEANDKEEIFYQVGVIYDHFKELVVQPEMINLYLDYLRFQLINLAKELNPEYDQEEVFNMINHGSYNQIAVRGSVRHFRDFTLEFANYLSELRQHAFGGVLTEIEKEITEHYMENLSLKSLSEKYFINCAYLGQIFKKQYGISFKDYLNNYRIDRAAELLIRTDEKIYLIAGAVGFNNTDYFISKFVQLKNKTPLQYRKQILQGH